MQPTDTRDPQYYHKVVDCQWACPAHTNVPEYIRLIAEGKFTESYLLNRKSNVFPGHPRAHLRPSVRAGVPAWAGRGGAGGDLPAQARRLRPPGRGEASAAHGAAGEERKEGRADRSRAGVAHRGERPHAPRLRGDDLRGPPKAGGLMRTNIPSFRLPVQVLEEEIDYVLDMGVDIRLRPPDRVAEGAARLGGVRRRLRRHGRAEGQGAAHPRSGGGRRERPHRHRVARVDPLRAHRLGRRARARHRRREHRDGLLPEREAARREGHQGHGAQDASLLQGLALGARRRRGRAGRDPGQPRPASFVVEDGD